MSSCLDEGGRAEWAEMRIRDEEMLSIVREQIESRESLARYIKEQENERKRVEKKLRKLRKRIKRLEEMRDLAVREALRDAKFVSDCDREPHGGTTV